MAIVSPVSRSIGVAGTARSIAFYRDVLQFEVREQSGITELVNGPARLLLDGPPTMRTLFFETDNVDQMRELVIANGGAPSAIDKVNWIKMKMFEVHDPDGHILLFGQSYHVHDVPAHRKIVEKALPAFPLDDLPAGVAYYRDVLGFKINYQQHDLGVMDRGAVTVLLIARTERHEISSFNISERTNARRSRTKVAWPPKNGPRTTSFECSWTSMTSLTTITLTCFTNSLDSL